MATPNKSQGRTYDAYYTFLKPRMTIYCLTGGLKHRGPPVGNPYLRIVRFGLLHT